MTREEAYKGGQKLQTYSNSLTNGDSRTAGFTPRTPTEMGRETTSPTSRTGTIKKTRGVRIDRVYLNFDIVGATLEVQTLHHPGSDHKGVLYRIRGNREFFFPARVHHTS